MGGCRDSRLQWLLRLQWGITYGGLQGQQVTVVTAILYQVTVGYSNYIKLQQVTELVHHWVARSGD